MASKKLIVSCGIVASVVCAPAVSAEATRSASSLPVAKASAMSVSSRRAIELKKKKNNLQDDAAAGGGSGGGYIIAGLAAVAVGAGVYVAVDDKDGDNNNDSPG